MTKKIAYLLDTHTACTIIKGLSSTLSDRLKQTPLTQIAISCVTEAQLLHGAAAKADSKDIQQLLKEFLLRVQAIPWDSNAAISFAKLKLLVEKQNIDIDDLDLMVAAQAHSSGAILISNVEPLFLLNEHLQIEDWTS